MGKVQIQDTGQRDICATCGRFGPVELDHPFRRINDPDYTIPLCITCHKIVTKMDNIVGIDLTASHAPIVFIMHRMRLAFVKHGIPEIASLIRESELTILDTNASGPHKPRKNRKGRNRPNRAPVSGTNPMTLLFNVASWANRAVELSQTRFTATQEPRMHNDYRAFTDIINEITSSPAAFCERLIAFSESPEGNVIMSKALEFATIAMSGNSDTPRLMRLWHESVSALPERVSQS